MANPRRRRRGWTIWKAWLGALLLLALAGCSGGGSGDDDGPDATFSANPPGDEDEEDDDNDIPSAGWALTGLAVAGAALLARRRLRT